MSEAWVMCNKCKKIFKENDLKGFSSMQSDVFNILRGLPRRTDIYFCVGCLKELSKKEVGFE